MFIIWNLFTSYTPTGQGGSGDGYHIPIIANVFNVGLPLKMTRKPQLVQNTTARLLTGAIMREGEHICYCEWPVLAPNWFPGPIQSYWLLPLKPSAVWDQVTPIWNCMTWKFARRGPSFFVCHQPLKIQLVATSEEGALWWHPVI